MPTLDGKWIMLARREKKWTQDDLAKKVPVSRNTIIKWEAGHTQPDAYHQKRLEELLGGRGEVREQGPGYNMPPGAIPLAGADYVYIPVFARIPCSLPDYSEHDVAMRQPVPRFVYSTLYPGAEYIVIAKGDSMAPTINEGALCYIRPCIEPLEGRIMLVKF